MNNKATKTGSPAVNQPKNSSTEDQNLSPQHSLTRRRKRKASPDTMTIRKRFRVSDDVLPSTSEGHINRRGAKRKDREDGDGQTKERKEKRRRLVLDKFDKETFTSSSKDTESCNMSVDDVSKRGGKRKAAAAEGDQLSKKRKTRTELKTTRPKDKTEDKTMTETNQKTTNKTKNETKDNTKKETTEDYNDTRAETSHHNLSLHARKVHFKENYEEQGPLGEGGCGSVFAGIRKADNLPVAIKHIPKKNVFCKHKDENNKLIATEVAILLKLMAGTSQSVGASAPVSLFDWYDLGRELILVLERPVPSKDLHSYIDDNGGSLQEQEAKNILKQLLEAAVELHKKSIFHRDIKTENILIETGSDGPRVRVIDFGLSCFFTKRSLYRIFYGTSCYTPPEWYRRWSYRPGPTTVWQLGVVLYEMLHSYQAFDTTEFLQNKLKISQKLTNNCQDFMRACLRRNPNLRVTMEELQHHPWLR